MSQAGNEVVANQDDFHSSSSNGSKNDNGIPHQLQQGAATTGDNSISFYVGDNSTVNFNNSSTVSRPSDICQNIIMKRKRTHMGNDSVDAPSSPKRLRLGIEYETESPSGSREDSTSHTCILRQETRQRKDTTADSKRKSRKNKGLKRTTIPNLVYNALKLKLFKLAGDELQQCVDLLREDCQGFGIGEERLNQVQSGRDFIKLMVATNLLSPDNLCFLQMVLHLIGHKDLLKEVNDYAEKREGQPITLHFINNEKPDGTCRVEFRIDGNAKHTKNRNVKTLIFTMAKNLGMKPHQINLIGAGRGSVMLVFQMPEVAVSTLRQQIQEGASWLKECRVLGVHIDGEEYIEITPVQPKGTVKFCGDCKSSFLQEFFSHLICTRSQDTLLPVRFQDIVMKLNSHPSICSGCSQGLKQEDLVYTAKDYLYHKECFSCSMCRQPICPKDEFFMRRDHTLLCVRDFKAVIARDIKKLQIFADVGSESTHPLDITKPPDAKEIIDLPKTTSEQACQTELPLVDQIDVQFQFLATKLTPVEWTEVCANLRITPATNSAERGKIIFEELVAWKQNLLKKGLACNELENHLWAAVNQANRHDLAQNLCTVHQMKGFDIEQCQRELRQYYLQHLCRIPLQCSDESTTYVDIKDIYIDLSLSVVINKPSRLVKLPLKSHRELFSSKVYGESSPHRIVLSGVTGSGKTTLIAKLAYEWAKDVDSSPLKDISLLFVLSMEEVDPSTNIEEAILAQLLPEDTNITADHLKDYISRYSSQVMVILDGFSESYSSSDMQVQKEREGSIIKATSSKILRECRMLVTTKSFYAKFDQDFASIEVSGFSAENITRYIKKFFTLDEELGEKLISYTKSNAIIESISSIPFILLEVCLLWRVSKGAHGIRTAQLYKAILKRIYYQLESNGRGKPDVEMLLKQLGKIALESVLSTTVVDVEGKSTCEIETSSVLEVACELGLMVCSDSKEKNGKSRTLLESEAQATQENDHNSVSEISKTYVRQAHFFHKTFQEFCLSLYLTSLLEDNPRQFFEYLEAHNDVRKALSIQSVLLFACGLSPSAADKIIPGLLEIYTSQLEHSMKKYLRDELSFEETSTMQEFILLCLVCNYEADAKGTFNSALSKLIPDGKVKFVAISYRDAVAIGYYLLYSFPWSVRSIKLQAIPKPGNTLEPNKVLRPIHSNPHKWPKPVSKDSGLKTVMEYLDGYERDIPQQFKLMARKTPLSVLAIIHIRHLYCHLPSETPHTLEPIITLLADLQVETCDFIGFEYQKNIEKLVLVMEQGLLQCLSKLKLSDTGLKGRQTERLAESLVFFPNLQELVLSHNEAGRCLPILGASLTVCKSLRILDIEYMQAPATDMVQLLKKFPDFGSELVNFNMTGNQMSDAVISTFLENVPKSCTLLEFGISLGDVSREYHRLLLEGIQDLKSLQGLCISHSAFPDDLLVKTSDLCKNICDITLMSLDVDFKILPLIKHSTWVEFKSNLQHANKLKKLFLHNIALEKNDFEELLEVGCQQNLTNLRYYTSCLPEDTVVKPDYDFLELL